jgi:hypothetical protein
MKISIIFIIYILYTYVLNICYSINIAYIVNRQFLQKYDKKENKITLFFKIIKTHIKKCVFQNDVRTYSNNIYDDIFFEAHYLPNEPVLLYKEYNYLFNTIMKFYNHEILQ